MRPRPCRQDAPRQLRPLPIGRTAPDGLGLPTIGPAAASTHLSPRTAADGRRLRAFRASPPEPCPSNPPALTALLTHAGPPNPAAFLESLGVLLATVHPEGVAARRTVNPAHRRRFRAMERSSESQRFGVQHDPPAATGHGSEGIGVEHHDRESRSRPSRPCTESASDEAGMELELGGSPRDVAGTGIRAPARSHETCEHRERP